LLLSLTLDELGKTKERDAILKAFPAHKNKEYTLMAAIIRETLAKGEKTPLDLKAVEAALQPMAQPEKGYCRFFVGMFLEQRGDVKNAKHYYAEAGSVPHEVIREIGTLAIVRLRALGGELPKSAPGK
jgi:hypothetical protein